jgi:hypothetical protein
LNVTVTGITEPLVYEPFAAVELTELTVGAEVSTTSDRVELNEELPADESTFFARQ